MYYIKIHESSNVSDVAVTENTEKEKEHNPMTEIQELKGCTCLGLNKVDVFCCHECVSLNNLTTRDMTKSLCSDVCCVPAYYQPLIFMS